MTKDQTRKEYLEKELEGGLTPYDALIATYSDLIALVKEIKETAEVFRVYRESDPAYKHFDDAIFALARAVDRMQELVVERRAKGTS